MFTCPPLAVVLGCYSQTYHANDIYDRNIVGIVCAPGCLSRFEGATLPSKHTQQQ